MQNAAFAELGLDWDYSAFDVEDPVAAVAALRTLGFVGANVTIPHKQAVVAACDEADGDAVNTLVFRGARVLGFNTDQEILSGIDAANACVIGAGGAARALAPALPPATRFYSRSGIWPPGGRAARPRCAGRGPAGPPARVRPLSAAADRAGPRRGVGGAPARPHARGAARARRAQRRPQELDLGHVALAARGGAAREGDE